MPSPHWTSWPQASGTGLTTGPITAPGFPDLRPVVAIEAHCHTVHRRPSSQPNAPGYGRVSARTMS